MSSFKVAALVMFVGMILGGSLLAQHSPTFSDQTCPDLSMEGSSNQLDPTFVHDQTYPKGGSSAQLSPTFYDKTCPNLSTIIRDVVIQAQASDVRAPSKLIRLHFHDCFVNGCDGSVLLVDAPGIQSELDAPVNKGLQGFEIVDKIKVAVETACPATVSCADILAVAALESVLLTGGRKWEVLFGRRDSRIANRSGAESGLPSPLETLTQVQHKFAAVGLDSLDLVALSGAHTLGRSPCGAFTHRLNNFNGTGRPDPTLNPTYRDELIVACPSGGASNRIALDVTTPDIFDNAYFTNLLNERGLLQTDQELFSAAGAGTIPTFVKHFAYSKNDFFDQFGRSMIKMGNISPPAGTHGEIRLNCSCVNPLPTSDNVM